MPLRVVTGRANAGKTGWIFRWAFEALGAGSSPTLIVPNLADVHRMQMELADKAPLGVRVSTAASFSEELWQLHGDGRRLVGDATRSAVMRQILAGPMRAEFSASAGAPGFERLMLRSAQQSPPFQRTDESVVTEADALVTELLERYQETLGELDLIEQEWIGPLLAQAVPRVGFLGALRFTTYSTSQVSFLSALSERNVVCVALTWEDGFAPTAANDATASAFLARAESFQVAVEPLGLSELGLLASRLYRGAGSLQSTGEVILGQARGREAEAALVARLAGKAVRAGVRAERVAVVFPQLAPRLNLLRNAVAAESLEADFDCTLTVGGTSFGRTLTALLGIALGRGARTEALEFLQSPFSDADPAAVLLVDREWRKKRQTDDSPRVLGSLMLLGGSAGRAASLCRDIARVPVDDSSAEKWQELADTLVSAAELLDDQGISREDAGAHRSVTRAVAQMASVPGHPFGAVDVLEALPTLMCALSVEESAGRIQIIQASRVGSRRFDEVIIGGLTQGETPGTSRETFASEVGSLVSGQGRVADESLASLEFYSLMTRARSRLALVRQTVSSDGVMQVASPLLDEVLGVYGDPEAVQEEPDGAPCPLEIERCDDARAFAPVFTQGRRDERMLPEGLVRPARFVSHGALDPKLAVCAVSERVFSATEIETYLECPYRWFYSRVLRPEEIDAELDAAALGSRAHRLIADFYEALNGEGADRVTPETLPAALGLFERSADQSEKKMAPPLSLGEEIDVGRARLWARHVVEDDANLLPNHTPYGHEVVFGEEAVFEFAGVPLAGRIDRIDVGPAGLVVSDYKSTRDVGKLARLGTGFGIQHVLYAAAAEHLLGQPIQGSVYRSLRTRRMRGFWRRELLESPAAEVCEKDVLDEAGYAALIALVEERVIAAVDGIKAGRIPRSPRTSTSCRYCTLSQICEGARS